MRVIAHVFFFVFLTVFLSSCNDLDKEEWIEPKQLAEESSVANTRLNSVAVVQDEFAYLQIDLEGKLNYKHKEHTVVLDEGEDFTSNNLWLFSKGKYIYAIWWLKFVGTKEEFDKSPRTRGKSLFVRASQDFGKTFSPKVRINSDSGVLPDIGLVADEEGHVSVIYSDERMPSFQVYTNSSFDGGKTWGAIDFRLDKVLGEEVKSVPSNAGTPHLVSLGQKLVAIWQQYDLNKGKPLTRLVARESEDHGKTWGDESVIFQDEGDVSSTLDVLSTNDSVYVFWLDRRKKGLILFERKQQGVWEANNELAPGTKDALAVSWLRGTFDEKYLYLTYTFEQRPYKDYVVAIKYDRKNKKWLPDVHRLDRHPPDLRTIAKSVFSNIKMLPNGDVVVVWEDYEDIMPGIHMDILSAKTGQWLDEKILMTLPGLMDAREPDIYLIKDEILRVVFYKTHREQGIPPYSEIVYREFKLDPAKGLLIDGIGHKPELTAEESEKIIRKKAKILWDARLLGAAGREKEWEVHNPVFKSKFNKSKFLKTPFVIEFDSYTIDDIEIRGRYAKVRGKTVYNSPKASFKAREFKQDGDNKQVDKEIDLVEKTYEIKFGLFYDDWYYMPEFFMVNYIDN